jgi:hypothetical protein
MALRASPDEAVAATLAEFDKNDDGKITTEEIDVTSGLAAGVVRIDANKDGALTGEELKARFETLEQTSDLLAISPTVSGPNGPLAGATLTMTPEKFMGEGLQSYSGTTADGGSCQLEGAELHLPGLPRGYYRAHVVHSQLGIDKVVGCEIADDASGSRLEIKL